jgi:hypothetical protein
VNDILFYLLIFCLVRCISFRDNIRIDKIDEEEEEEEVIFGTQERTQQQCSKRMFIVIIKETHSF